MNKHSELEFVNFLKEIPLPNCNNFDNIDTAYSNFLKKVKIAIDKIM